VDIGDYQLRVPGFEHANGIRTALGSHYRVPPSFEHHHQHLAYFAIVVYHEYLRHRASREIRYFGLDIARLFALPSGNWLGLLESDKGLIASIFIIVSVSLVVKLDIA
jgi:hypothetical protein